LPGDSPPAHFYLVCNKIMLENPHIFLVKTGSKSGADIMKSPAGAAAHNAAPAKGIWDKREDHF
jgi:hypothetical protein